MGDVVYVELPQAGQRVKPGDVLGTIESVKAVSEILAPIGGTVLETNEALDASPETINRDPHGDGWYCKLEPADAAEIEQLMDAGGYEKLIGG